MPTVPTFAVRDTDVSRHNGGTSGAPLKPLRDDSALTVLSSLRGLRGAPHPRFPHYAETSVSRIANFGTVGKNGLTLKSTLNSQALPRAPEGQPDLHQPCGFHLCLDPRPGAPGKAGRHSRTRQVKTGTFLNLVHFFFSKTSITPVTGKFHLRKFHRENTTCEKFFLRKIPPLDNSTYGNVGPVKKRLNFLFFVLCIPMHVKH